MKRVLSLLIFIFLLVIPLVSADASPVASNLSGKILLQVESAGEAWYVDPFEEKRYFLGRPNDAFEIMRNQGVGATDEDLAKIPLATELLSGKDSDGDGLPDDFEIAIGTDPHNPDTSGNGYSDKVEIENNYDPLTKTGRLPIDRDFAERHKGKIFLQVQGRGEAWYVSPDNGKRYFLGRPYDAFEVMRNLGLGVKNQVLDQIPIAGEESETIVRKEDEEQQESPTDIEGEEPTDPQFLKTEKRLHELVNQERSQKGLNQVEWNYEVAEVARKHSQELAERNTRVTGDENPCDLPMIHHEGLSFGFYNGDRLKNQGVDNFYKAAENIALVSTIVHVTYSNNQEVSDFFEECETKRRNLDDEFRQKLETAQTEEEKETIIRQEVDKREELYQDMSDVEIAYTEDIEEEEVNSRIVQGWMNSPPHRRNILDEDFNQAGMGVAHVNGFIIATQSFIQAF